MDDWLTIPPERKSLPTGRLCVILALTVLLLVVAQVPRSGMVRVAGTEGATR